MESSDNQNFETKFITSDFSTSGSGNFSIETLIEEIKSVTTEKDRFEYQGKWILATLFVFSDYHDSDSTSTMKFFFDFSFTEVKFLIDSVFEKTKPVFTEKQAFEFEMNQCNKHLFEFPV